MVSAHYTSLLFMALFPNARPRRPLQVAVQDASFTHLKAEACGQSTGKTEGAFWELITVPLLIGKAASPNEEFQRATGNPRSLRWAFLPGLPAPGQPTADTLWLRNSSCPVPIRIAPRKAAGARNPARPPFLTSPGASGCPLP